MEKDEFFKKIDQQKEVDKTVQDYLGSSAFTARKITDTPKDDLQIVNRKYITRYSTTALRPTTSVLGECYFDTTVSKPVWWNGTNYQDAAGNVV